MQKKDLIESLLSGTRSAEDCKEIVDAVFEQLMAKVNLKESLFIEGIGHLGAHKRKGANRERPNKKGVLSQKNLSIFFHPTVEIQEQVKDYVQEKS